jgi:hypothetical protein
MKAKTIILVLIALGTILMVASVAVADSHKGATVVREGAIWYDGELYRTVLTPTQLPDKAPEHSFDVLYSFYNGQKASVADAAPGNKDYNGGRWVVYNVTVVDDIGILTSVEDVWNAAGNGSITISDEPVTRFVCPMIKLN